MHRHSRKEWMALCKENAYQQYAFDLGGYDMSQPDRAIINACTSMLSDLCKHPETKDSGELCAFMVLTIKDEKSMRKFIDGFI